MSSSPHATASNQKCGQNFDIRYSLARGYGVERQSAKGYGLIGNAMGNTVVARIEASSLVRRFFDN